MHTLLQASLVSDMGSAVTLPPPGDSPLKPAHSFVDPTDECCVDIVCVLVSLGSYNRLLGAASSRALFRTRLEAGGQGAGTVGFWACGCCLLPVSSRGGETEGGTADSGTLHTDRVDALHS